MLKSVTFAASSQTYANENNNKKKKRNPFRHKEENFNFFYLVHYCTFLSGLSITHGGLMVVYYLWCIVDFMNTVNTRV